MESLQLKRNSSRVFMLLLSFLILATSLVVFYPFIFQKKPFIFGDIGSDTFAIYYPFFVSLFDKIESSDFTFWTFQYGFGVNILSRQSDVGSVFTWLLFLLGKENIKYMLVYVHILKILLSGIACFAYLSFFKFDNKSKLIAAYLYAFNGFTILWGQHYFFGTACLDMVLVLLALEYALRDRRGLAFLSIAVAVVLLNSYYLAYMILLATALYTVFRMFHIYTKADTVKAVKSILGILVSVIIGVAMSSVLFLPSVYQALTTTSRVTGNGNMLERIVQTFFSTYGFNEIKAIFENVLSNNLTGGALAYTGIQN